MQKEIYDKPKVINKILNSYCKSDDNIIFPETDIDFLKVNKMTFIACGSFYYAACIAKIWFEKMTQIQIRLEIASEFLYNNFIADSDLFVFLS